MDWYTAQKVENIEVSFVPATHYADRGFFDQRESLWGGYIFKSNGRSVYFAGDTGFSDVFKEIHEQYNETLVSDSCFKNRPIVEFGWRERAADSKYIGLKINRECL